MGIFDKKKSISREELKSTFRKDPGIIPGTGGKKFFQRERDRMTKELFGPKYGSQISKEDWRNRMRELQTAQKGAKTSQEKKNIKEHIRYLKEKAGKNI